MMDKERIGGKKEVKNVENKSFLDKEHKHIVLAAVSLNVVCVCFVYWFCNSLTILYPKVDSKSYFIRKI